jgi:hypothetical protein
VLMDSIEFQNSWQGKVWYVWKNRDCKSDHRKLEFQLIHLLGKFSFFTYKNKYLLFHKATGELNEEIHIYRALHKETLDGW